MKEGEVKHKLSPAQVSVMLHKVTEPPYFGRYWDHFEAGIYRCAACDAALFSSDEKFDSKTGWPSFRKPINEKDLQFKSETGPDDKIELRCKKCKSHLGYVIAGDNPYYRINSVCLSFVPTQPVAVIETVPEHDVKKDPAVFPSAAALEITPQIDTASPLRPLLIGAVIGMLLGALGMWLYGRGAQLPTNSDVATTTVATTTETAPTTVDETPAPRQVEEEPSTPVVEPAPEQTPVDSGATSTQ